MDDNMKKYILCMAGAVLLAVLGAILIFVAKLAVFGSIVCALGGIAVWVVFYMFNRKNDR
ncbi:MAG: hypothetical protein IJ040_00845 [Lachnospiraceae bacterium]|nr:hypothetical protein [Lachnospiraceae bacterium]